MFCFRQRFESRDGLHEVSRRLYRLLDGMGYSQDMIVIRRCAMQLIYDTTATQKRVKIIGSLGEGLSKMYENDLNLLNFDPDMVCVEPNVPQSWIPNDKEVVVMFEVKSSPGYYLLSPKGHEYTEKDEKKSEKRPGLYTRSLKERFLVGFQEEDGDFEAQLAKFEPIFTTDKEPTIKCICPGILWEWAVRVRKYDWPPLELRQDVTKMSTNLVNEGVPGSKTEAAEWRLCFDEIELLLMENLNETQLKLYKLLKIVREDLLSSHRRQITSYLLKTIVFWLAETFPASEFRTEELFSWLIKALKVLKRSVQMSVLPHFMIPARNLLTETVTDFDRKPIVDRIRFLIHCGPDCLLNCSKLDVATKMTPADLNMFKIRNDDIEKLYLLMYAWQDKMFQKGKREEEVRKDKFSQTITAMMHCLLSFNWPEKVQQQFLKCSTPEQAFKALLS